jgi:putative membrane protein
MLIIVTAMAAVSYISALACARVLGAIMPKLDHRAICILVLAFLAAMALTFTGFIGLFVFFLSTVLGMVTPLTEIKKIHVMGLLIIPLILYYFSW